MKWKSEVTLTEQNGWQLCMAGRQVTLTPQDTRIARAMEQGGGNIEQLKTMIAQADGVGEAAAALTLAQFILRYGDFIADDD